MAQVIVVGGGLAGLSAAHTVLEHGGRVLLLDKNGFLGGNSTKATSGINGALTRTQIRLGIKDSVESFYDDTAKSAKDLVRPPLVKVLTGNSASAVEWLQEKFALDLSLVSRLGGHSFPRTHRGKEKFPGMTITYALMEKFETLCQTEAHRAKLITKACVTKLLKEGDSVVGVEYEKDGQKHVAHGPVVIATGGYAADFDTPDSLLKKYRPDVLHLPTTNGDHSTGDGIKLSLAIGGHAVDLEKVQVHPTGLVDPAEPDSKLKYLAAEALRGVGGLLLDKEGQRFCDELGRRDYVTGEMWKNKPPFRLVLNSAAGKEIEWHCKHYQGRGLMKFYPNGAALAADMGISAKTLEETYNKYNEIAKSKKDPYGKQFFDNAPFRMDDSFWVSIVTPVVHFTMGGLEINHEGEVLGDKGTIKGLYAAGEVAGGVHGANRLGGSSLLGCVVFGRVAGDSSARFLFDQVLHQGVSTATRRLGTLSHHLGDAAVSATVSQSNVQTRVSVSPESNQLTIEVNWDGAQGSAPAQFTQTHSAAPSAAPVAPAAPAPAPAPVKDKNQVYTWEEVAKHNTEKDVWVVVNGQVLDVTNFLKDHPGGKKPILIYAGRDATEEFNMLHKADVVEKYAPESIIGKISGPPPKKDH